MKVVIKVLIALLAILGIGAALIGPDFGYARWWALALLTPGVILVIWTIFTSSFKQQERYHITE